MNPKAISTVLATVSVAVSATAFAGPFASTANAQGLSERIQAVGEQRREAARTDVSKAKLLGALLYADVTVAFDKTTAKTAFEYVAQQMGVPLVVRYAGEGGSDGIDPELEVSLSLEGTPAITVIERLLEICGTEEPCTWQIREGFVEAGTKERLAAPAARELRMYPIRDLLFQPPTFDNAPDFNLGSALSQGNQGGGGGGGGGGFGGGGGGFGGGGGGIIGDPGEDPERESEEELADQLMEIIQDQCEPEGWVDAGGDWATMKYYQGVLLIRAPDFIHRQIDGYPFAPQRPRRSSMGGNSDAAGSSGKVSSPQANAAETRRYITFTTGLSIVENVQFRSVPIQGAVGGTGTTGN
jgi:uncharacterized membrane protein YgcG